LTKSTSKEKQFMLSHRMLPTRSEILFAILFGVFALLLNMFALSGCKTQKEDLMVPESAAMEMSAPDAPAMEAEPAMASAMPVADPAPVEGLPDVDTAKLHFKRAYDNPEQVRTGTPSSPPVPNTPVPGTESYSDIVDNGFQEVRQAPLSTFSIDVDTASYSNVRRFLDGGQIPPADAVRIEELINYFDYSYAPPTDGNPFAANVEVAACPWNAEHYIARIGLKGFEMPASERPNGNYVFLVDVSGSMDTPNRLPLVKESLKALLAQLGSHDRVGIVTYASGSAVFLQSTACSQKKKIEEVIDKLYVGGGTNGSAGIREAYAMARANFIEGGINRVILATDGDFNVGLSSHGELEELIATEAKSNVFLTALGYGMGNYKDDTLELLADKGNGNYAYIDSFREVRRVLVQKLTSNIMCIAKDVKIQVELNPAKVASYRLIGYENRMLAARDFNDDTKDAGEIGAGHTVTALYEIVPIGASPQPGVDPLRYQEKPAPAATETKHNDELFLLKLRYKEPEGDKSALIEIPVVQAPVSIESASADTRFVAAVAAFGMTLRNSPHKGVASLDMAQTLAGSALNNDEARKEFLDMIVTAKTLVK